VLEGGLGGHGLRADKTTTGGVKRENKPEEKNREKKSKRK
jgi:hypothetical protein